MHRAILSRMGRTGQNIRASPSSNSQQASSSHTHPYALHQNQQRDTKVTSLHASLNTQQTPTSNAASLFLAALTSAAPSSISVPTYSLPAESITTAPMPKTTSQTLNSDTNSESSHYMSDDWSPFNMPSVKQCVSSGIQQQQGPLLGQMVSTPIYTPMYTPPYPMSCDPQDTFEDSELFTKKTYAGYRFPHEDVTVRIMDIDSGEFLKQFPHR